MSDHIYLDDGVLYLLDQRFLPFRETYIGCRRLQDVIRAINNMTIRGAPLIGIVAAYGVVIGMREVLAKRGAVTDDDVEQILRKIRNTRPTAVNLFWALGRMRRVYEESKSDKEALLNVMTAAAVALHTEDARNNRVLGEYGAGLIRDGDTILTHCNAGALATGGHGTALGVIKSAFESGKKIKVIATETRPYFQGARLTAWELRQAGIDVELVPDNHAGLLCSRGMVDRVIVGADRIALNGDTANKIGTYMIALCAHENGIPFYIAAPVSTFDPSIADGSMIEIEQRDGAEVKYVKKTPITLKDIKARYFGFDVTPERYISKIITEKGILDKPFRENITGLLSTGQ